MNKTVKIGVIASIVASFIFVYLIDPIIRFVGESVLYASRYVGTGLIDYLYQKSALGVAKDPSLTIFAMVSGVLIGMIGGAAVILLKSYSRRVVVDVVGKNSTVFAMSRYLALTLSFVLPVLFIYQLWQLTFQYQIVTSFDQHVRILSPYIEVRDKEKIESEFALMQSERDYLSLYEKLNVIAADNGIVLPDNPSYSFWSF